MVMKMTKTMTYRNFFLKLSILLSLFSLCITGCSDKKKEKNLSEKSPQYGPVIEVNFDDSMGKGTDEYQSIFTNSDDVTRYNILKSLYENNVPSKIIESPTPKIPKLLHQIWLGPKMPPGYFATFRDKWMALHPDWEYKLWTDADIRELNPDLADLIDQSPNYAEKSDILRSEILDRLGGVYFDVDMEPHHSLEELHHKYDLYIGVEYPHKIATTNNKVWLGISIMAARPGHPVIKRWKEHIRARWEKVNKRYTSPIERVINHTYFPFSIAFFEKYQDQNLTNIAFPATYFYPLSASCAAKRRSGWRIFREKLYEVLENLHLKTPKPFSRVYPESIAVHYWGNTWVEPPHSQLKDLQSQVDLLRREFYRLQQKVQHMDEELSKKTQRAQENGVSRAAFDDMDDEEDEAA